jgi:hypothetical protein
MGFTFPEVLRSAPAAAPPARALAGYGHLPIDGEKCPGDVVGRYGHLPMNGEEFEELKKARAGRLLDTGTELGCGG